MSLGEARKAELQPPRRFVVKVSPPTIPGVVPARTAGGPGVVPMGSGPHGDHTVVTPDQPRIPAVAGRELVLAMSQGGGGPGPDDERPLAFPGNP